MFPARRRCPLSIGDPTPLVAGPGLGSEVPIHVFVACGGKDERVSSISRKCSGDDEPRTPKAYYQLVSKLPLCIEPCIILDDTSRRRTVCRPEQGTEFERPQPAKARDPVQRGESAKLTRRHGEIRICSQCCSQGGCRQDSKVEALKGDAMGDTMLKCCHRGRGATAIGGGTRWRLRAARSFRPCCKGQGRFAWPSEGASAMTSESRCFPPVGHGL